LKIRFEAKYKFRQPILLAFRVLLFWNWIKYRRSKAFKCDQKGISQAKRVSRSATLWTKGGDQNDPKGCNSVLRRL
jgi:hypothetical protein